MLYAHRNFQALAGGAIERYLLYHLRSAIRFDRHDDGRRAVLHPFHDNLAVVVVVGVQKEAGLLAVRGDRVWRDLDCDFGTIGLAKRSKQKVACRVRGEDAAPDATWSSSWRRHGQPTQSTNASQQMGS